ncbi:hypothetical protein F2Q70_00014994 [Brassica cretica]|uniref:Uncharacterized protein n=1 Tax=Brassica cretica TaxID=69181 RepID=A0A8S9HWN7_BRACR|nr:hypothetical protein F2Q70_00014994 [Brassica cretica]
MSLFLSRLRIGVRRSSSVSLLLFNGFSTSLRQSPPGFVIAARFCGHDHARLTVCYANQRGLTDLDKRVPMNLVYPHIHNDDKTQNDRGISWVDSYSKGRRHPSSPR